MAGKSFIQRLKRVKNSLFSRGSILAFMNDSFFFLLPLFSLLYFTFFFLYYLFSPLSPPPSCSREFWFEETGTVFEGKKERGLIRWFQALVNNLLKVKSSCLVAFRHPLFFPFVFRSKIFESFRISPSPSWCRELKQRTDDRKWSIDF